MGDTVALNQIIAEVETAKAVVELPSPFAGVVTALHEQPGTVVEVGKPIVSFEVEGDDGGPAAPAVRRGRRPAKRRTEPRGLRRRRWRAPAVRPAAPRSFAAPARPQLPRPLRAGRAGRPPRWSSPSPATRPRCRSRVGERSALHAAGAQAGQGPRRRPRGRDRHGRAGLITRDDVRNFVGGGDLPGGRPGPAGAAGAAAAGCRRRASAETRTPIKGVRKFTAAAMVASAFTAPHVTEFLTVDVTPTMELLARLKASRAFAGYKLTPLTSWPRPC